MYARLVLALILAAAFALGIAKDCEYLDDDYQNIIERRFKYYGLKYNCDLEKEAYLYFMNRRAPPQGHRIIERRVGDIKNRDVKRLAEKMAIQSGVKYKSSKGGCYIGEVLNGKEKHAIICVFTSRY